MKYLLLILIISSCSSLSKKECEDTNWFVKGLADAQDGAREPKTKEYRDECYSQNVKIKSFDYLKGYEDGTKSYCTEENAKLIGVRGEIPHKVCEEINSNFKPAYQSGLRDFLKNKAKEDLISKYGNECFNDSDCNDGKSCRSTMTTTRFADQISIQACQ